MSLPKKEIYLYHGLARPTVVSIYEVFEMDHPIKLLLVKQEDFEFCDTLHMMFGRTPFVLPLWDWHDTVWDEMHNMRNGKDLDSFLRGVATTERNLLDMFSKPYLPDVIKQEEMARRKRLSEPQPTFNFKGAFF